MATAAYPRSSLDGLPRSGLAALAARRPPPTSTITTSMAAMRRDPGRTATASRRRTPAIAGVTGCMGSTDAGSAVAQPVDHDFRPGATVPERVIVEGPVEGEAHLVAGPIRPRPEDDFRPAPQLLVVADRGRNPARVDIGAAVLGGARDDPAVTGAPIAREQGRTRGALEVLEFHAAPTESSCEPLQPAVARDGP